MKPSVWQRLDTLARQLTPLALTLVLMMLGLVPLGLPGWAQVAPMLPLMAVYHWTIYRPDLMPALAVFAVGVLQDALSGMPMGVGTLSMLIAYGIVLSQRRFFVGKSFPIVWLGFGLVAAGVTTVEWLLVSAVHMRVIAGQAGVFQYMVSLGAFPFLSWLFSRWQGAVLKQE